MSYSEWFNDDQVGHMESLGKIPRDQRCLSGWHVTAIEECDCWRLCRHARRATIHGPACDSKPMEKCLDCGRVV